jgi:hypothetical protein
MTDDGKGPDSAINSGLPCPKCGRSLNPLPLGTSFVFHCRSGHEISAQELATAQALSGKSGIEKLLHDWRRQVQTMSELAEGARKNGHLDVAEIFNRQVNVIQARIEHMRAAFPQEPQ